MTRPFRLILPILAAALVVALATAPRSARAMIPPDSVRTDQLRPEQEEPWRFTFTTNGNLWLWWSTHKDTAVTWDYGTEVLMEIARGRGHRIWYGGAYRLAAGYSETQSITPFDPSQVDSWLYAGYRYAWKEDRQAFLYARRVCFHLVDRRYTFAVFWTHAAFGIGTTSPMEEGEEAIKVRLRNKPALNGYLSAGPFIHGGPSRIFGHTLEWQWETSGYLSYTYPVTRTFLLDLQARADWLYLLPEAGDQHRFKARLRLYLIAQRDRGNASFFVDRVLHDDYIERFHPVAWRFGLEHRF